jgi:hypothetical protein
VLFLLFLSGVRCGIRSQGLRCLSCHRCRGIYSAEWASVWGDGIVLKSKPYLLPVAILDPIGSGSVAALGIADHRYDAKTDVRVGDGFFFRPETAAGPSSWGAEHKPLIPKE